LDVSLYRRHRYLLVEGPDVLLSRQAARYAELMEVFLRHDELTAVTFGVSRTLTHT